jgi:prepilin-type N-terminal cleavage/methylation domain-containing protein|tara:strand:- start:361 stop:960 length:600 start_codon:yes stop_codon:yes gene_type:complete
MAIIIKEGDAMQNPKGFTLIELMVTCSILSILLAIVIPNFNEFIIKTRVDSQISQLHHLLLITRNSAINYNQDVTLCPLNENLECTVNWQDELSVFVDFNNNGVLNPESNEKIIKVKAAVKHGDQLQYGLKRNKVKFAATGRTTGWGSNGTFKLCPQKKIQFSRAIIVSTSGRFYLSSDIDNDGKDENRRGTEIICRPE